MTDAVSISLITSGTTILLFILKDILDKRRVKAVEIKVDNYHKEVNGMKSELVEAVRGEAAAKGEIKGAAENQALTDAKEQSKK